MASVAVTAPHAGWYEDRPYPTLHQNNVGDAISTCVQLTYMYSFTLVPLLSLMFTKLISNTVDFKSEIPYTPFPTPHVTKSVTFQPSA